MFRRSNLLFCLPFLLLGCNQALPTEQAKDTPQSTAKSVSPECIAFDEKYRLFAEEVISCLNLFDISSDPKVVGDKIDKVKDLYTRIPSVKGADGALLASKNILRTLDNSYENVLGRNDRRVSQIKWQKLSDDTKKDDLDLGRLLDPSARAEEKRMAARKADADRYAKLATENGKAADDCSSRIKANADKIREILATLDAANEAKKR
jgi:hypothetical protein